MAPRLSLLGDPRSIPVIVGVLRNRVLQDEAHANARVDLLLPLASIARHGDVAAFDAIAHGARDQLTGILQHDADSEREIRPYLTALDRLDRVISVARGVGGSYRT